MLHPTYELIRQLILKGHKQSKLRLVDYGCGTGLLINLIGKEKIAYYHGYDVSENTLRVARKKFTNNKSFRFKKINKKKLPVFGSAKSFDVVVLIGVLQYLEKSELEHVLTESKRILKKSGIVVISCAVDHPLYVVLNLYQFFIPHRYINRHELLKTATQNGFKPSFITEKGILIAPFISHCLSIFFDALDKLFFRTKGKLGPIGSWVRAISIPLIQLEYKLPIDYGYTLFLVLKKTN